MTEEEYSTYPRLSEAEREILGGREAKEATDDYEGAPAKRRLADEYDAARSSVKSLHARMVTGLPKRKM